MSQHAINSLLGKAVGRSGSLIEPDLECGIPIEGQSEKVSQDSDWTDIEEMSEVIEEESRHSRDRRTRLPPPPPPPLPFDPVARDRRTRRPCVPPPPPLPFNPVAAAYQAGREMPQEEAARMRSRDFETRIHELYKSSVVYADGDSVTVNFASLHRASMHYMQKKLLDNALRFKYEKPEGGYLDSDTFTRYVQALKDQDYMRECSLRGTNSDPFLVSTKKSHERILLQQGASQWRRGAAARMRWAEDADEFLIGDFEADMDRFNRISKCNSPLDEKNWMLFGGSRNMMNKKEALERFFQRVGMACIGGAFLIGPMLVMSLHQTRLTALLTASICVFGFGLVMAIFLDKQFDVLSATAAYAAVMVVFVGTSTPSPGNGS